MDTRLYWIWLQQAVGRSHPMTRTLLEKFSGPQGIYAADHAALKAAGIRQTLLKKLCDKSLERSRAILSYTLDNRDWLLTPDDALYPEQLRAIDQPPLVLYGRGEPPRLQNVPVLTIVGTRKGTADGIRTAEQIAAVVAAAGVTVVSGGALGIDAAAHRGALRAQGKTILLMPCSLDVEYPRENAALRRSVVMSGGTLLTEYAPTYKVNKGNFHERNRILSGLSQGTCVVEAPKRSGALMTANFAREQGRDVYSVPGSVHAVNCRGTNRLIQSGATMICSGRDLLEDLLVRWQGALDEEAAERMEALLERETPAEEETRPTQSRRDAKWEKPDTAKPQAECPEFLSPAAKAVFAHLGEQPLPVDALVTACGMAMPQVMAALTELELAGCVRPAAGHMYAREG